MFFLLNFVPLLQFPSEVPHLEEVRLPFVGDVHDVYPGRPEGRHHQPVPHFGGVVEAGRAGVPPHVVQLVVGVGHVQAVDHLRYGGYH